MQISILLLKQIVQLFLMILMGYIMVKIKFLKEEDSKVISKIILYLIVPSVIITAFQVDYTPSMMKGLAVACIASVILQFLLLFVTWIMGKMFHLNMVEYTSAYYSNSGNLIVPLVTYILGKEWVIYGCVFMSVQLFFIWTHCKCKISGETEFKEDSVKYKHDLCIRRSILILHEDQISRDHRKYPVIRWKHDRTIKYDRHRNADRRRRSKESIYKQKNLPGHIHPISDRTDHSTCSHYSIRNEKLAPTGRKHHPDHIHGSDHTMRLNDHTDVSGVRKRFEICKRDQCNDNIAGGGYYAGVCLFLYEFVM